MFTYKTIALIAILSLSIQSSVATSSASASRTEKHNVKEYGNDEGLNDYIQENMLLIEDGEAAAAIVTPRSKKNYDNYGTDDDLNEFLQEYVMAEMKDATVLESMIQTVEKTMSLRGSR